MTGFSVVNIIFDLVEISLTKLNTNASSSNLSSYGFNRSGLISPTFAPNDIPRLPHAVILSSLISLKAIMDWA